MKILRILIILLFIGLSPVYSQKGYEKYSHFLDKEKTKEVIVLSKLKKDRSGTSALYVKFKNKSKVPVNIDISFGYMLLGAMEEEADLSDCLKKSCFDNWFRRSHVFYSETLTEKQLTSEDMVIELTKIIIEQTDECRETHR